MRTRTTLRRTAAGCLVAALTSGALLALPSAASAATATDEVASGDGWTVTDLGGTYEVSLDLDAPLAVKDDAPTLVVDGKAVGLAQESDDGTELTVLTSDTAVAKARSVKQGWFGQVTSTGASIAAQDVAPAPDPVVTLDDAPEGTPDPTVQGSYPYVKALYKFGDQSIALAGIGGIRGEVEGKIYLPTTGGARPVVIFLHGRHTSCSGGTANPLRWPCNPNQIDVPSYAGYDAAAEALASNGYAVVSISANAINANDNQLALDYGAQARGQLILDTLGILQKADEGTSVTLHDAATDADVTLADALAGNGDLPAAAIDPDLVELTPADLVGRFDLSRIGIMGHSRGGEGVASALTLNEALAHPFHITSVLPLAPVDFGRMTLPDVPSMVVLPYCDGDVSNQQGKHFNDDSRYAFGDDVLRSDVWVMGADHNFFNSVWTPATYPYASSDDWSGTSQTSARATDSVCGTATAAQATSIRLSSSAQYQVGAALIAGWFRLTVGGEQQYLPMFDGSGAKVDTTADKDVRVLATQPSSARADIERFDKPSTAIRPYGTASATVCASLSGRTVSTALPACSTLASAQVPQWTPASFAGNVPASPVTRMLWTSGTGEVRVTVPAAERDASAFTNLSVKLAADESVAYGGGTDLTVTVLDGKGASFSAKVSDLNPNALVRLPQSTQNATTLGKVVLQQVNLPLASLTGLDLTDLREVRFTAAVGIDGLATGGAYLSDLAFDRSSLGTAVVRSRVAVNTHAVSVEEGAGPGEDLVHVSLTHASTEPVTAYVTIAGTTAATSKVGVAMKKVTFAPGETCKAVGVASYGDSAASTAGATTYKVSVTNTQNAVMGADAFAWLTVREDDGVTAPGAEVPAVGRQGDPCAELAALSAAPGDVTSDDGTPAPGQTVTLTATGYRAGESVAFTLAGADLGTAIAGADGTVALTAAVPTDVIGRAAVTAVGAGTGRTSQGELLVLHTTATALTMSPAAPGIGDAVTLTATVTGASTAGTVTFTDGATVLGTAPVADGTATLALPGGFKAGAHAVAATFGRTATDESSTSDPVTLTLVKGHSSIALVVTNDRTTYGAPVRGKVAVANADGGSVRLTYGSSVLTLKPVGGVASFTLPASLVPGTYTVTATFTGTDRVEPSGTATAKVVVAKKGTASSVSVTGKAKVGAKVTTTLRVSGATAGTSPTGTVKLYVREKGGAYKLVRTVTLSSAAKGVVTTSFTAPKKAQTVAVRAVYSGDSRYAASSAAAKSVTVVKK